MFVIKPTDHNGFFFPAIPLALNAAMYFLCEISIRKWFLLFCICFFFVCVLQAFMKCTTPIRQLLKQLRLPIGKAVVRGNGTIYSASLVVEVMWSGDSNYSIRLITLAALLSFHIISHAKKHRERDLIMLISSILYMVMEAQFKAISAIRNIHLSAGALKRSAAQSAHCLMVLINGLASSGGFCSLLHLIHAFLGNDAQTAIIAAAVWMIWERNDNHKEMEEKETENKNRMPLLPGDKKVLMVEESGGVGGHFSKGVRLRNNELFLTLHWIIRCSPWSPQVLIK